MMEDVDLASDTENPKEVAVNAQLRSRPLDDFLNSKQRALMPCASAKSVLVPPPPRWETSCYKRWEILVELVRLDTERELGPQQQQQHLMSSSDSGPGASLAVSVPPPRSRFFIGGEEDGEEDWDAGEGDESWSEERWDEVLAMTRAAEDDDDVMIVTNQVVVH